MATRPNFGSLLDDAPDHVDRPKSLPAGSYEAVIGRWEEGKSARKGTPFVKFSLRITGALDDVDEEELEAAGGAEGKSTSVTFYLTPESVYRLDSFHEHAGLDLRKKMKRSQRNDEVMNSGVGIVIEHRWPEGADQEDPEVRPFVEVRRTFKPE